MRTKWFFRNEPTSQFSEIPAFFPSLPGKLQSVAPNREVFLNQLENEIFKLHFENVRHSNTSKEVWEGIRALADVHTVVIKKANNGSCVVVWERTDYLLEAEKQLYGTSTCKSIEFKGRLLTDLVEYVQ